MKKSSGSSQKLGSFLSPGAPNYREKSLGNQKGWSSERGLHPATATASSSRSPASAASLTPFNGGRTMPSKWDEAERWICSPVSSGYAAANGKASCAQLQPRPKSKSGPIVPPGIAYYYSNYSPTFPQRQPHGSVVKNSMVGSPFSTGVLAADAVSVQSCDGQHDAVFDPGYDIIDNGIRHSSPVFNENGAALLSVYSASAWSELPLECDPSSPNSQDKGDGSKNEDAEISLFSKRDKGTQMSPPKTENDAHPSPKSSATSAMNKENYHSTKSEVKDVQVDSQATVIRWSKTKRHATKLSKDLRESSTEAQASCWDIAESTMDSSTLQREEAKITAWESLQKAKAEAAIRKLEVKLEKRRSSSMDKILNKLKRAQMKAEKMRSLIPTVQQQGHQVSNKTRKVFSFPRYARRIWSPSSCFTSPSL